MISTLLVVMIIITTIITIIGAVTFDHFINASKIVLPHNNNVFIMTDDPRWLKRELNKYNLRNEFNKNKSEVMNIFSLPARPQHRSGSYNASVDFWASVTIARQVVYYDIVFIFI